VPGTTAVPGQTLGLGTEPVPRTTHGEHAPLARARRPVVAGPVLIILAASQVPERTAAPPG
jgi:hypothetical protein